MEGYTLEYTRSVRDPEGFWLDRARAITWFSFPRQGLTRDEKGLYRWFEGGKLNTCYLAVDHHVLTGRAQQPALVYDSPVTGVVRSYTYAELLAVVEQVAGMLKGLGVEKGDRVLIYMPMIPEAVFSMLACARLGAIHSVVFGGFAPHEVAVRIDDATPKVVLTASGGIEVNKVIPYKPLVDEALRQAQNLPEAVVVLQRDFVTADVSGPLDHDWDTLIAQAQPATWVEVDATDPLYVLYTSGTTGTPKGIIRDNGGHAVALKYSMEQIFHVKPGDAFWAASDVGWVVGHSYIVYAPLIHGCTTVLYEGKPVKTPDPGAFWRVISQHKVRTMFTAPTAIRAIKKEDPNGTELEKYDLSNLRYLFLAGERCDAATYHWAHSLLKVPVIDNWWQTESGWPMIAQMPGFGLRAVKPGSASTAVSGFDIRIIGPDQQECAAYEEGAVCIKYPLPPSCLPTLWQNDERFIKGYLEPYPGYYFSGDGGYKDEDGYIYITGRIDDIINVAGHRLSTAEMEEAVAGHPDVAECAVIGIADELKGQIPVGFVVLKEGVSTDAATLGQQLVQRVRDHVGPVASFRQAVVVKRLPKTRSGKILRKVMRAIADGTDFKFPSTIEDPAVLDEVTDTMRTHGIGEAFISKTQA